MKASFKKLLLCVLAGLATAAIAPSIRADTAKGDLFRLGHDLWVLEHFTSLISREPRAPTALEKQVLARCVEQCTQNCKALALDCDSLFELHRERAKLSVAEYADRATIIQKDIFKDMEKRFGRQPRVGPSAQSYFLLGRYTAGALVVAEHCKSPARETVKNRMFIDRMCYFAYAVANNARLEVTKAAMFGVLNKGRKGIAATELYDAITAVRAGWLRELEQAPPLAMKVQPSAQGEMD